MTGETLKQWYVSYLKNRDLMLRKIAGIDDKIEVAITYKDSTTEIGLVRETLGSFAALLENISKDAKISIVVYNTRKNIDILISEWNILKEYTGLSLMFVNPKSATERKWQVKPHVHDRITEPASLKLGIDSIAMNVELL